MAEKCRSADGGDLQFSNALLRSAAPDGQPENQEMEAASTHQ